MTYFLNPFPQEFRGNWVLGDRAHIPVFVCAGNFGRSNEHVVSWANGPFDLSGTDADGDANDTLRIWYAIHTPFERWALMEVDITTEAASAAAVTHAEIVDSLNTDEGFSSWFTASLQPQTNRVQIRSRKPAETFRFYIDKGQAETKLKFNARASVSEMPSYFDRHKVTHLFSDLATMESFDDRMNILVPLAPYSFDSADSQVDDDVITNAVDAHGKSLGLDPSDVQADWELLRGRAGLFMFKKQTVDGSSRITEIIEYPAGAKAGDMAKKTQYQYTGAKTAPDEITEIPYVLQSGDLVTPGP